MIVVDTDVLVVMAIESGHLQHRALDLMNDLPADQGVLPTVLAGTGYLIDRFGGARYLFCPGTAIKRAHGGWDGLLVASRVNA